MKRGFGDHSPLTEKINEWSDILVERERRAKVKEVGAEVEDVGCLKLEEAGGEGGWQAGKGGGGKEELEKEQQA